MTKSTFSLPDFRNLGIQLHLLLAAEALGLTAALFASGNPTEAPGAFIAYSTYLQPPLLFSLGLLYLLGPWLKHAPAQHGVVVAILTALVVAVCWRIILVVFLDEQDATSLARAGLLAMLAAGFLLLWHDWRARRLSPALPEARLQSLQARIRPHLLFNSLNSVLSLIRSDPKRAEAALEDLADLYRVLMGDNSQLSMLRRELELAQAYLDLEGLRLNERLKVELRTSNAPSHAMLPPMLLQPLLENAVYHGVEGRPEGGSISLDIFARQQQLHVVVKNPIGSAPRPGNSMALSNIRERLALHFDAEARLSTHEAGGVFHVQVVMPLRLYDHAH